jgi:hypothetical protein
LDSPSWEFNAYVRSSLFPSDLLGVNPTTLNGMILYYRLMTKRSGLGDSTKLSRMELSQWACALVQSLGYNLLSVSQLLDEGFEVLFGPGGSQILDSRGDLVCMVVPEGQVFRADFS